MTIAFAHRRANTLVFSAFWGLVGIIGFWAIADEPRPGNAARQSSGRVGGVESNRGDMGKVAERKDQSELRSGDVELKASRVYAFVGKTGLGHEHAVVGTLKSGELHFGRDKQSGKLEFDMRSFVADTPDARKYVGLQGETDRGTQQKVNQNMLGPDVLDVARFPTATFEITSLKKQRDLNDGAAEYLFEGKFTLHGVVRPIRFAALVEPHRGWQHVRGRFVIRQTDFGITPFTTALGAVGVANELTIFGDLWVRPEQPLAETPQEAAR